MIRKQGIGSSGQARRTNSFRSQRCLISPLVNWYKAETFNEYANPSSTPAAERRV